MCTSLCCSEKYLKFSAKEKKWGEKCILVKGFVESKLKIFFH